MSRHRQTLEAILPTGQIDLLVEVVAQGGVDPLWAIPALLDHPIQHAGTTGIVIRLVDGHLGSADTITAPLPLGPRLGEACGGTAD